MYELTFRRLKTCVHLTLLTLQFLKRFLELYEKSDFRNKLSTQIFITFKWQFRGNTRYPLDHCTGYVLYTLAITLLRVVDYCTRSCAVVTYANHDCESNRKNSSTLCPALKSHILDCRWWWLWPRLWLRNMRTVDGRRTRPDAGTRIFSRVSAAARSFTTVHCRCRRRRRRLHYYYRHYHYYFFLIFREKFNTRLQRWYFIWNRVCSTDAAIFGRGNRTRIVLFEIILRREKN